MVLLSSQQRPHHLQQTNGFRVFLVGSHDQRLQQPKELLREVAATLLPVTVQSLSGIHLQHVGVLGQVVAAAKQEQHAGHLTAKDQVGKGSRHSQRGCCGYQSHSSSSSNSCCISNSRCASRVLGEQDWGLKGSGLGTWKQLQWLLALGSGRHWQQRNLWLLV